MKKNKSLKTITLFDYPHLSNASDTSSISDFPIDTTDEVPDIQITSTVLGEGGMGIVFEGKQRYPNRPIAIKRLKVRSAILEQFLRREAMITGRLAHPNIIPVHILRPSGPQGPEVIMPLLEGNNLLDILEAGTMSLREALSVLDQVCNGLRYAHEHNIIHRDIKPENIIVGTYGEVYLVDWGIALDKDDDVRVKAQMVGTPAYMPPEMISGKPEDVTIQTDIYLLGATLHHILTGQARHKGDSLQDTIDVIKRSDKAVYPNHIFSELGHLSNICCHPIPAQRPKNVAEFQNILTESLKHWDIMKLISKGEKSLLVLREITSSTQAYPVFLEARGLFLQAAQSWPEATSPQKGLIAALEYMIECCIQEGTYQTAQTLYQELEQQAPDHNKKIKYKNAIQLLEQNVRNIQKNAQDNDLSISRKSRIKLAQLLTAMAVLGTGYVSWEVIILGQKNNYDLLLWSMLTPTIAILVILPFLSELLLYNKASRIAFVNVFATMMCMIANRALGVLYEEEINRIITTDIFIIAMYWAHMTTQSRKAGFALITTLIFGFWSIASPAHAFWMMNITILLSTSTTAYFWVRGDI